MVDSFLKREVQFKDVSVLVMEDNGFLRSVVVNVLVGLGVQDVRYVRSPHDALREFVGRGAHVVIVECGAEFDAACDLFKKLRKSPQWKHGLTGLVALVPKPNRERVIKVRDAGAEAIIAEPIAPGDLADHVRTIVNRHFRPQDGDAGATSTLPNNTLPGATGTH